MQEFRTLDLAVEFFRETEKLRLTGNLRDQLHRAASSISLNLSEGNAKRTPNEKRRYFHTAYASTQECKTILKLANCKELQLHDKADRLGASIYKLMNAKIGNIPYTVVR